MYTYQLYHGGNPKKRTPEEEAESETSKKQKQKGFMTTQNVIRKTDFTKLDKEVPNVTDKRIQLIEESMTPLVKKIVSFTFIENIERLDFFTVELICGFNKRQLQLTGDEINNQSTLNNQILNNNLALGAALTAKDTLTNMNSLYMHPKNTQSVLSIARNFNFFPFVNSMVSPAALIKLGSYIPKTKIFKTVSKPFVKLEECDQLYKMLCEQSGIITGSLGNNYRRYYLNKYPYLSYCIDFINQVPNMIDQEGEVFDLPETKKKGVIDSFRNIPYLSFGIAQFYMSLCMKCEQSLLPTDKFQVYLLDMFKDIVNNHLTQQQQYDAAYGYELCRLIRIATNISTLQYLDNFVVVFKDSMQKHAVASVATKLTKFLDKNKNMLEIEPSSQMSSTPPLFVVDGSKPSALIKIKLINGLEMTTRVNLSHTVEDLKGLVASATPNVKSEEFELIIQLTQRALENNETVESAGLMNQRIYQMLV